MIPRGTMEASPPPSGGPDGPGVDPPAPVRRRALHVFSPHTAERARKSRDTALTVDIVLQYGQKA
eukprot:5348179-Prymnesium_polylepis.1